LTPELDDDVKRGGFVQVLEDLRFPKKNGSVTLKLDNDARHYLLDAPR
jgi:hypothetical protein